MSAPDRPVRILMVCLGNICRSPTAEAVMVALLEREGLADRVEVASAGTGDWHVGDPPDARSTAAAARRGVHLRGAAQQVTRRDFADHDLLVAMDASNRRDLLALAGDDAAARDRVVLLRELDPAAVAAGDTDVPDPYYGGPDGFDVVLDVVEAGCVGLLAELRARGLV
nr:MULTISPECIES: low molecular weight protein-tyrosine-phosphatase [Solirubrobacterales]